MSSYRFEYARALAANLAREKQMRDLARKLKQEQAKSDKPKVTA